MAYSCKKIKRKRKSEYDEGPKVEVLERKVRPKRKTLEGKVIRMKRIYVIRRIFTAEKGVLIFIFYTS